MTRRFDFCRGLFLVFLLLFVCAAGFGQVNVSTLTGRVTDSSGGVVGGAQVVLLRAESNTTTQGTTNGDGIYNFPDLQLGSYTVTVSHSSFKTYVQTGIFLSAGDNRRLDVQLQIGSINQRVEVTGEAPVLETESGSLTSTEQAQTLEKLPIAQINTKRDPTEFFAAMPGYQGNSGVSNTSSINGSLFTYSDMDIDGASMSYSPATHGGDQNAFSIEGVGEFKVVNAPDASMGNTGGAIFSFTSRSGTDQLHGSAYEYGQTPSLDARSFFSTQVGQTHLNEYGFKVGGPVYLPKIYNGKGKTFFFFNFGESLYHYPVSTGFDTVPTPAVEGGNFSALEGAQVGTDLLGRPVYQGEIYDPNTTRQVTAGAVDPATGLVAQGSGSIRDPFANNTINSSRFSTLSGKFQSYYPTPTLSQPFNNLLVQGGTGDLDERYWSLKGDQYIGKNHFAGFYWNSHWTALGPNPLPAIFHGIDTFLVVGHNFHFNWDRSISPSLVNNFNAAITREMIEYYFGSSLPATGASVVGFPNALGPCLPSISISGWLGAGSTECYQKEGDTDWSFIDNVSYQHGKHLIKVGGNFLKWTANYPVVNNDGFSFQPSVTGLPGQYLGQTGWGYASFLLGDVYTGTAQGSAYHAPRIYSYGLYVQDNIHVTSKLTANLGLRWDVQPFPVDHHNEISDFMPTLPNPGAGNLPGAVAFAGFGQGLLNKSRLANTKYGDFGPRIGFAYQFLPKTVVRGAWGLYYGWVGQLAQGFAGISQDGYVPNLLRTSGDGFSPVFQWDGGFPYPANFLQPTLTPTIDNGSGTMGFDPNGDRAPHIQNVNFSIERQLPSQILLSASYYGTFARDILVSDFPMNQLNYAKYGSLGSTLTDAVGSAAAQAAGVTAPYAGFAGTVLQALRPFPQYLDIENESDPAYASNYNSFQLKAQKRFSNGLTFLVGYTISKNLTTMPNFAPGAFAGGPIDQYNLKIEKQPAFQDIPQQLLMNYTYELPFGSGKKYLNQANLATRLVAGGWSVAGIQTYQSGTALGVGTNDVLPTANSESGLTANQILGQPIRTSEGCSSYQPGTPYLNINAFTDPAPWQFGTTGPKLGNLRACPQFNENFSVFKAFPLVKERAHFEIAADFFNIFNRHYWTAPGNDIDVPQTFGLITGTGPGRVVQFHARVEW